MEQPTGAHKRMKKGYAYCMVLLDDILEMEWSVFSHEKEAQDFLCAGRVL